ncbi:hypothetical protein DENSPDRAFT_879822 [Dentipellis sp. KUC8613]|nr:hypothetical protein DENSPDRAFT_879822 [Dentipellis sp. KUC8613]
MYTPETLQAEQRSKLQILAVKHGIKGTLKSKVIISRLLKKFPEGVPKASAKKPFRWGIPGQPKPPSIKREPSTPRTVASTRSMGDRIPSARTRSGRTSWTRVESSTPRMEASPTARRQAGKRKREEEVEEEEEDAAPVAGPSTQPPDSRRSSTLSSDDEPRPIKRIRIQDEDISSRVFLDARSERVDKGKRKQVEEPMATPVPGPSMQPLASDATQSSTLSSGEEPGPSNRVPSHDAAILDRVSLSIPHERAGKGKRKRDEETPVAGPSTLPTEGAPRATKRVRVASPVNETASSNEEAGRRLHEREPTPAPDVSLDASAFRNDEMAVEQMLSHPRPFFKPARHLPVPLGPTEGLTDLDLDLDLDIDPEISEELMSPPLSPVTQSLRDFK